MYGNSPIRLMAMRVTNSGAIIEVSPFRDLAPVRISCENITSAGINGIEDHRVSYEKFLLSITESRIIFVSRNIVVLGMIEFDAAGSNVEKMSGIIQGPDLVYWRL